MNVCGEHGDEITHAGNDCPACDQIEDINKEHGITVDDLENQVSEGDEKIGELEERIKELES